MMRCFSKAKRGSPWVALLLLLGSVLVFGGVAQASPQYDMDCSSCHTMPPLDSSGAMTGKKDPFTGAVPGRHQTHAGSAANSCAICHGDQVTTYQTDHRNKVIELRDTVGYGRKPLDPAFMNQTSVPPNPLASCSTAACHSDGKGNFRSTPAWGSTDPANCSTCHDATPSTGKHTKHLATFNCTKCHSDHAGESLPFAHATSAGKRTTDVHFATAPNSGGSFAAGSCSALYCHSDGKGAQKTASWTGGGLDCKGCHGSDASPAFTSAAGEPNYTSGGANLANSNSHQKHVTAVTDCVKCHNATVDAAGAIIGSHVDGSINVAGAKFSYGAGKTCSTNTCHSGNGIVQNVAPAQWGATLDCQGCHSTLSSSHAAHTGIYGCVVCHSDSVTDSTHIKAGGLHMNEAINVAGSNYTAVDLPNHTCTTSCHMAAAPNWTQPTSGQCGSCHNVTSPLIATNAHAQHFTAVNGPHLAQDTTGCQVCHIYTGEKTGTHVDGTKNLNGGFAVNGACGTCHKQTSTQWATPASVTCESCHSTAGGALSVINGKTAPDKTMAASAGHGKTGIGQSCTVCHSTAKAHIGVAGGTNRLFSNYSGSAGCNYCHDNVSVVTTASKQKMKIHTASGLGSQCSDCHNPHGTTNNVMVNTTINGTTVSYTGTSTFANEARTGVCQVCHSYSATGTGGTKYFTMNGQTQESHVDSTQNCLECHSHNPSTGLAFVPNGACNACHGYPPAPRKTTYAVSFGTQGQWSTARFEDYSGGGGAHLVAKHLPKDLKLTGTDADWTPCLPCHFNGKNSHAKVLPVRSHVANVSVNIDPQYRFSNDYFAVYTSAAGVNGVPVAVGANTTGQCFNVNCHFKKAKKWSIER